MYTYATFNWSHTHTTQNERRSVFVGAHALTYQHHQHSTLPRTSSGILLFRPFSIYVSHCDLSFAIFSSKETNYRNQAELFMHARRTDIHTSKITEEGMREDNATGKDDQTNNSNMNGEDSLTSPLSFHFPLLHWSRDWFSVLLHICGQL